jgi:hypothetical protein
MKIITYSVYLLDHMLGSGRFAGPGLTREQAKEARRYAYRLYRCSASIDRD